jgi:hypothetical protein
VEEPWKSERRAREEPCKGEKAVRGRGIEARRRKV